MFSRHACQQEAFVLYGRGDFHSGLSVRLQRIIVFSNHLRKICEEGDKIMICTAQIIKRTAILWVLIALLLIPAFSEARVISVQMSAPTIAFGGYSWPGVGQYEKITGVAYAEVDPADRRNAIIVDIGLAANAGRSRAARQDSQRQSRVLIKLLYSQAGQLEPGRSEPQRLRQGDV